MKNLTQKPPRSYGKVGDVVTVLGREYQKSPNGVWGPVVNAHLLVQIKDAYVNNGMTLRATAQHISDSAHTFSSSVIQNIVNEQGWMRSHYGEADAVVEYLNKHRAKIFKLYDVEAFTLRDLVHVTGTSSPYLTQLFANNNRPHVAGRRTSAERVNTSRNLSTEMVNTWNKIITTDANDCEYQEYKDLVRRLTDVVYRKFRKDPVHRRSYSSHLDHILSLKDGYWEVRGGKRVKRKVVVPFRLMAHPLNLRLVDRQVNLLKGDASLHSHEELEYKVSKSKVHLDPINRKKELRMIAQKYKLERYEKS